MDCVIYTRVSTERQEREGHSLEFQLEKINEWTSENGHNPVRSPFTDVMGGAEVREDFEEMKKFVFQENVKLIVCWEISRFGRSSIASQQRILEYKDKGVNVHFIIGDIDTLTEDAYQNFHLRTLFNIADLERNILKARFGGGRESALKAGKRIAMPKIPYGITIDKEGYIMPHPLESKWVRRIFEWYLEGDGYSTIAKRLTNWEPPVPTKTGGEWRSSMIRNIIEHKIYTGWREIERQDPTNPEKSHTTNVELSRWKVPIIDSDTFEKANKRREQRLNEWHRDRPNRSSKDTHKFKGKVFCGHCGKNYGVMSEILQTNEGDTVLYAYRCSGVSKKTCKAGQFHQKMFDDACMTMMLGSENYITYLTNDDKRKQQFEEITAEKNRLESELEKTYQLKSFAYDASKNKRNPAIWYHEEMRRLNNSQNELISRLKKQESKRVAYYKNRDLFKMLFLKNDSMNPEKIKKLVDRIVVYNVKRWNFNWNKIPKEYKWISYREKTGKFQIDVLDRGFNKTPANKNDKVIYIELFFTGYDIPEKGVISTVTKNAYIGDRITYNKDLKELSLNTSTQTA